MKVVIVTGSRGWTDKEKIRERILFHAPDLVIQGGQSYKSDPNRSVDYLTVVVCEEEGIPCESRPADWRRYPGVAGFIRNGQMLDEFPDAIVEAFWDGSSPGTGDCIRSAEFRGMKVEVNRV